MRRSSNVSAKVKEAPISANKLVGVLREKEVPISANKLVDVLREIEVMLQSLHRVGSFYANDEVMCDRQTARIIDDYNCAPRLSKARSILLDAMRRALSEEDVAAIEDVLGRVRFWRAPKGHRT
jgi:hypothetical protein